MRQGADHASVRGTEIFGSRTLEQAFTAEQASRLSGCTHHQLRYWDRVGLVSPSIQSSGGRPGVRRLYSFRDLVALRVVRSLLDNGMSLQRVRRAWEYLRREGAMDEHLAQVKLVTDGKSIFRGHNDASSRRPQEGRLASSWRSTRSPGTSKRTSPFQGSAGPVLEMLRRRRRHSELTLERGIRGTATSSDFG